MSFEESDYFKSENHIINAKNASIKGNQKIQILKKIRIEEYNSNPKRCKNCDNIFDYKDRKKIFCDPSCSASYNNKKRILSQETKNKIANSLKGRVNETKELSIILLDKICPKCQEKFKTRNKKQIYCSQQCARLVNGCSESAINKIKIKVQERIKNGTFSGWKSRKKMQPSYPEQYFINLFNNQNIINWEKDYPCGKWFIDFAFIDKMIALEIDGSQHEYTDRKESDEKKDKYLIENGWNVIRIKWYNPINNTNKEKLYKQIEEFKNQYVKQKGIWK
jgi:very-short-patch-repair endonuclease